MGHDISLTCPKCNPKEETPNHHVEKCKYYQALRMKVFGKKKHYSVSGWKTKYESTGKVSTAGRKTY